MSRRTGSVEGAAIAARSRRRSLRSSLPLLGALALAGCQARCSETAGGTPPAAAQPAATTPPPAAKGFTQVTVSSAMLASLQALFSYHDVVPSAVYLGSPVRGRAPTIMVLSAPEPLRVARAAPAVAVKWPDERWAHTLELMPSGTTNLAGVVAFDFRDTDGDGVPEILLVLDLVPRGDAPKVPFRRAFHIALTGEGKPQKTLVSWEIRADETLATIDDLASKIADSHARGSCPPLAEGMEDPTVVLAVRCMVERDQRATLAGSVRYPIEVLLPSGEVRALRAPADLLEVYDGVVDDGVRGALREGEVTPFYGFERFAIGKRSAVMIESMKIGGFFHRDAEASRRLSARLSKEERRLWQPGPGDVLCRTARATHVVSTTPNRRSSDLQLATWDDPRAVVTRTAPSRVVFGTLWSHGSCGNDFYRFFAPEEDIEFAHHVCYGPDSTREYDIVIGGEQQGCLNHRLLP